MADTNAHTVKFTANPTQKLFIESRAEADLFDCRKGEGKSAALVWSCFFHTKHNPGARWLFIRDTWENLRRTTLNEFLFWFPDGIYGTWKKGDKTFVWDTARTGMSGEVVFMGVESEEDASKIASMPLAAFAIDEPSGAAGESSGVSEFVFETAFNQLRQPGMNWYAAKLAQNNPDESHWTYRKFWDPGTPPMPGVQLLPLQQPGYATWQTKEPENLAHLPPGYYDRMKEVWKDRPDLLRRFVEGKHGFQQVGIPITPEWNDALHLAQGLRPVPGAPLHLLYDGGLNPTCIITQVTPMGDWLILEDFVGQGIGMLELITDVLKPALQARYRGWAWSHIGDPNLRMREQSSSMQSASRAIIKELGGRFIPGAIKEDARTEPLRAMLRKVRHGRGVVQVDRDRARRTWHALRGGWHRHVQRSGVVGQIKKNIHSHPGDALGYGAGHLFPLGKLRESKHAGQHVRAASYFDSAPHPGTSLGMARRDVIVPKELRTLGGKK